MLQRNISSLLRMFFCIGMDGTDLIRRGLAVF